jgi:hypothetical protein
MEKAMKNLPASKCIGWIKVDAKPLKKSLQSLVSRWSYAFIKYLQDKVTNEMDELDQFMAQANIVLDLKVGYDSLEEEQAANDAIPEGVDVATIKREREGQVRRLPLCVRQQELNTACKVASAVIKGFRTSNYAGPRQPLHHHGCHA